MKNIKEKVIDYRDKKIVTELPMDAIKEERSFSEESNVLGDVGSDHHRDHMDIDGAIKPFNFL